MLAGVRTPCEGITLLFLQIGGPLKEFAVPFGLMQAGLELI